MTTRVNNIEVADWDVQNYELGRHWPEAGDYELWHDKAIESVGRLIVVISDDSYSTNSGGTGLLVKGIRKDKLQQYNLGKLCPECGRPNPVRGDPTPFDGADSVASHLVDEHKWDAERARLWLRDRVEEVA
jgi:hypothetical protein